jgi:hypothetical protein
MYFHSAVKSLLAGASVLVASAFYIGCNNPASDEAVTFADNENSYVNFVGSVIKAGQETAVNDWYNNTHIPILWGYAGLKKAIRYQTLAAPADTNLPSYWAVYYYATLDDMNGLGAGVKAFDSAMAEMGTHWPNKEIASTVVTKYQKIKGFEKKGVDVETQYINIVAAEFDAASDAEINTWYNDTHIPMLMKYDGMVKAVRLKKLGGPTPVTLPTYLAIYYYSSLQKMTDNANEQSFKDAKADAANRWGDKLKVVQALRSARLFVKTR